MKNANNQPERAGYIVLRQMVPHQWLFDFPRLTEEVDKALETAIDMMDGHPGYAKKALADLIKAYPEHIDACHHLALTWHSEGDWRTAAEIWEQGVKFALKLFPPTFSMKEDQLQWGFIENRPFLRLYQGHGLSLLRAKNTTAALEVFENLLRMSPSDNQGNRATAVDCYFLMSDPAGVLAVCDRYPTDAMEQTVYGRSLALFQLKRMASAKKALRQAIGLFPRIAEELLKARHRRPREMRDDRIAIGGKDQAYAYWEEQGQFWEETPGALEWLRNTPPSKA